MGKGKKRRLEAEQREIKKKILLNQDPEKQKDEEKNKRKEEAILESLQPVQARAPQPPKTLEEKQNQKRLIVILENAPIETVKCGIDFQLLNSDDHAHMLTRDNRDPADYRPDIVHQCLLALFDSPLNKAGLLEVYIHTQKNVLIEISPQTRLPRTFKRFSGLMVQLLHKMSIRATNGPDRLMRVIKNPITDHLPIGCHKIAAEVNSKVVNLIDHVKSQQYDHPVAYIIGAMPHGNLAVDYAEETISFSQYPLSAAAACAKLTTSFEYAWGVV